MTTTKAEQPTGVNAEPSAWPLPIQQKAQAIVNLKHNRHYADFPELNKNHDGEDVVFCGECGKRGETNPDNDLCVQCEQSVCDQAKDQPHD